MIMAWTGRSARTVRRWLARFASGGVEELADAPRGGRPPQADAGYLEALDRAVDTPPPSLGLPFDVWTSARLSAYLAETTGVRIAPGWLRALLARRRFACGRPKHTLKHLQDEAEVAACEHELAAAEKKAADRPGRRHQSPGDRLRQRRAVRPGAGRGAVRDPGFGRVPAVRAGAGRPPRRDRPGDLPGARQRPVPPQQGEPGRLGRTRRLAARHLAGPLQPGPQPQGSKTDLLQGRDVTRTTYLAVSSWYTPAIRSSGRPCPWCGDTANGASGFG